MATHTVCFQPAGQTVTVTTGTLLTEAARQADIDLNIPCGGQGRCGRCAVMVQNNAGIRRRSTLRLTQADLSAGYALACQSVVEGKAVITIPPQEKIERRLTTDKTAQAVTLPFEYQPEEQQPLRLIPVTLTPPDMADQTDDWSRLKLSLRMPTLQANLPVLQNLGAALRENNWHITVVLEQDTWDRQSPRLLDVLSPTVVKTRSLWGVAVDIGTTTVSLRLVNLVTGQIMPRVAEYNSQIKRGEDIISRIIYAGKNNGLPETQSLITETINQLLDRACRRAKIEPNHIYKMTVAGNSTMIHLFLGLSPTSIRLDPFVTTINQPPPVLAGELKLGVHPQATVDCLPGVAGYVGADISAGIIGSQMCDSPSLTLFLDVGTNGEMVLGDCDWLISCACSAGPAFEGGGVADGMRATTGAIEEVWINGDTFEPTCRVIPNPKLEANGQPTPPKGICGSGLISLLAELFITGVIDKSGNLTLTLPPNRVRQGQQGPEYVIVPAKETGHGRDIVITKVDIDNLMRAKGAIYAGFTLLAQSVGLELAMVERLLIGGAFGQYINVEKAVQIGLLPDIAWDKFRFLGNTSLRGALLALLHRDYRTHVTEAAAKMTYLELSADNSFYEAFTSALFLPHTNLAAFPSVEALFKKNSQRSLP